MTFSLVAALPATGEVGVAVASMFPAVGAIVPWARAGAGAIATQAAGDRALGARGLALLESGRAPEEVLATLLAADPDPESRQLGIVAADGRAVAFSGSGCEPHASSITGDGYAAQGNLLAGRGVVESLVRGFLAVPAAPLADRLIAALLAAEAAGGDRRGRQSAALVVERAGAGYGGRDARSVDLRVDDHPAPLDELLRLRAIHALHFERPDPATLLEIDPALRRELEGIVAAGLAPPSGERSFPEALEALYGWENLEERWIDADHVDPVALEYLRRRVAGR